MSQFNLRGLLALIFLLPVFHSEAVFAQTVQPTSLEIACYGGNDAKKCPKYETWLGRPVDGILAYVGFGSWSEYNAGWLVDLYGPNNRKIYWSIPLIVSGANLVDAGNGAYDNYYRSIAETLAKFRPNDPIVYVRPGWELNGDWFPWNATGGKDQAYKSAFRRFVTVFRSVSNRFRFEWNVNIGGTMDPTLAYPGDDVVDIVGMDFYWNLQWDPADPAVAWNYMQTRQYGLQWHKQFANAHGKAMAYSEWGIGNDQASSYIDNVKQWFVSNRVVFHAYWEGNDSFQGALMDNQYPNAAVAFKRNFSAVIPYTTTSPTPTPTPTPTPSPTATPAPTPTPTPASSTTSAITVIKNVATGKCADVFKNSLTVGEAINQYTCYGSNNQNFQLLTTNDGATLVRSVSSGLCLQAASTSSGAKITQQTCSTSNALQRFELVQNSDASKSLKLLQTSVCLDVPGGSLANEVQLVVATCATGTTQKFTMPGLGGSTPSPTPSPSPSPTPAPTTTSRVTVIKNVATGKCADVFKNSLAVGEAINQFTCYGSRNQDFQVLTTSDGASLIRSVSSSLCLQAASTANGAKITQQTCSSSNALQRFELVANSDGSKSLKLLQTSVCIDVPGSSQANEVQLIVYSCHGGANQRFTLPSL